MEKKNKEVEIEEVELWPAFGRRKIARIVSKKGKINWIEFVDPDGGKVGVNSIGFMKLISHLSNRDFLGVFEKIKVK